jgi:hypothetical protein
MSLAQRIFSPPIWQTGEAASASITFKCCAMRWLFEKVGFAARSTVLCQKTNEADSTPSAAGQRILEADIEILRNT